MSDMLAMHLMPMPIVAILRGVRAEEVGEIASAVYAAGVRVIEIPLNSPDPLRSIEIVADCLGDQALIGAGTVTTATEVDDVFQAGGRLIVSPHTDAEVIGRAHAVGMAAIPGVRTPTEAFEAVRCGASHLKFFPAAAATLAEIRALRTVLPQSVSLLAVGGVSLASLRDYLDAGVDGFGVGAGLYSPGDTAEVVYGKASDIVNAWWYCQGGESTP